MPERLAGCKQASDSGGAVHVPLVLVKVNDGHVSGTEILALASQLYTQVSLQFSESFVQLCNCGFHLLKLFRLFTNLLVQLQQNVFG